MTAPRQRLNRATIKGIERCVRREQSISPSSRVAASYGTDVPRRRLWIALLVGLCGLAAYTLVVGVYQLRAGDTARAVFSGLAAAAMAIGVRDIHVRHVDSRRAHPERPSPEIP